MNDSEIQLYGEASQLAVMAMGKVKTWRHRSLSYAAHEDPGAWWCLTKAIVAIAERYAAKKEAGE